jgi:hypothetical protein
LPSTYSIRTIADNEKIPLSAELNDIVQYYQNLFLHLGGRGLALGGQAYGFGASISFGQGAKGIHKDYNTRLLLEKVVMLCRKELNVEGIFVLVNNLDILSKQHIISLINPARDELFDIPGMYWILVGQEGLGNLIESECERVADYVSGSEIKIKPLEREELREVVDTRANNLRVRNGAESPLDIEDIKLFHDMSLKELRGTFRICGEVVKKVISGNPSLKKIPRDLALRAFVDYSVEKARDLALTENNVRILSALYEKQKCRPKDFESFGYKSSAGFISALQSLVKKKLLTVEEKGQARIYSLTGMTLIAGISGALGKDIQDSATGILYESIEEQRMKELRELEQLQLFVEDDDLVE